jgi:hypothetical protein
VLLAVARAARRSGPNFQALTRAGSKVTRSIFASLNLMVRSRSATCCAAPVELLALRPKLRHQPGGQL